MYLLCYFYTKRYIHDWSFLIKHAKYKYDILPSVKVCFAFPEFFSRDTIKFYGKILIKNYTVISNFNITVNSENKKYK